MADKLRGGSTVAGNLIWHTGNLTNKEMSLILKGNTITVEGDTSGSGNFDSDGNVTINITVKNDSHTHDARYYTESESNGRFPYRSGNLDQFADSTDGSNTISTRNRDFTINGKRALVGYSTADGDKLIINFGKDFSNGVSIPSDVNDVVNLRASTIYEGGTSLVSKYLGKGAKAVDSDKLDGLDSGSFLRSDATDYQNNTIYQRGYVVNETSYRNRGIYGTYDSAKINHIWSMGISYKVDADGSTFGNLYGLAYKHTNNTTGGTMAGGHQIVFTSNGVGMSAMGEKGVWTSGYVKSDRVVAGYDSNVSGSVNARNWFRSNGATGWYNGTYGGGIYMSDTSWVRVHNNKKFLVQNTLQAVSIVETSDKRLKSNIKKIENALDTVQKVQGVSYNKVGAENRQIGFIAQDLEKIVPEVVEVDEASEENYLSVGYGNMTALLVESTKELNAKIEKQNAEIESLKILLANQMKIIEKIQEKQND